MKSELLTTEQLAKRWGVSTGTLRNWRSQGKGPSFIRLVKKGSPVRYYLLEIKKWEQTKNFVAQSNFRRLNLRRM